jgi:hypothetical protein
MVLAVEFLELGSKLCLGDAFVYGSSMAMFIQGLKHLVDLIFDFFYIKSRGG